MSESLSGYELLPQVGDLIRTYGLGQLRDRVVVAADDSGEVWLLEQDRIDALHRRREEGVSLRRSRGASAQVRMRVLPRNHQLNIPAWDLLEEATSQGERYAIVHTRWNRETRIAELDIALALNVQFATLLADHLWEVSSLGPSSPISEDLRIYRVSAALDFQRAYQTVYSHQFLEPESADWIELRSHTRGVTRQFSKTWNLSEAKLLTALEKPLANSELLDGEAMCAHMESLLHAGTGDDGRDLNAVL